MTAMCPLCGYNLVADASVTLGGWRIVPRQGAFYRHDLVITRHSWVTILLTLARENGRHIAPETLLARYSESENLNTLASTVSQMKRYLALRGIPMPIAGRSGGSAGPRSGGYAWIAGT